MDIIYYNLNMNKKYILILLLIVLLGIGVFFGLKSFKNTKSSLENKLNSELPAPKPEKFFVNPINGIKINSNDEPEFLKNRPLAVMINNATPARPQAGISEADIVYEIVAEGGITRFLAFFYSELPQKIGPIRSVREYYLPIVKELGDAMFMHIGFSPQAQVKINEWDVRSLAFGGASFYRDNGGNENLATEHTAFANAKDLFATGLKLGWGGKREIREWKFKENQNIQSEKTNVKNIKIDFWYEGDYTAYFEYDEKTNEYIRYSGKTENSYQKLLDRNNNKEVRVKNLIVQFSDEVPIPNDDKGRLDYRMIGKGKALYFLDGSVQQGYWEKKDLNSRTTFYLDNNSEAIFNIGKIWVSVVPSRNEKQVYYTSN